MASTEETETKGEVEATTSTVKSGNVDVETDKNESTEQSSQQAAAASSTPSRAWDFSNRKVIIRNTMKHMKNAQIDKMVKSWCDTLDDPNSIRITKQKKAPNHPWILLTLEHEDMVQPFIDHMNKSNFTNRKGIVLVADRVTTNEESRKRKGGDSDDKEQQGDAKRQKQPTLKTDDNVRDTVTPLWRMSYQQQLAKKQRDMVRKCALKIVQEVKKRFRTIEREAKRNNNERTAVPIYDWINAKRPIHVETILPSPKQTQYRNKCEMNFGYSYELAHGQELGRPALSKTPSVGFHASGWSGGVSRPHMLSNVPSEACAIVDVVNAFLKDSPTTPYDSREHRGVWRTLTIRISRRTKECMVVIMHTPPSGGLGAKDETDDCSLIFESEKARLVSMLTDRDLPLPERDYKVFTEEEESSRQKSDGDCPAEDGKQPATPADEDEPSAVRVTSVFFQEYEGLSNPTPEHPVQHAFGKHSLQERLGQCTFQISPGAFFQVNTEGAETLYSQVLEKVREVSPNPEETLLLDVCCGTGTIGQYCMKEGVVGRVLGVDISEPAIEDAKMNAELNGFGSSDAQPERTRFVASRAEQVLGEELRKKSASASVVAVVDPAREGLHADVIRTLRSNGKIQRIVYVSCNPTGSLIKDAGLLCAPPTKRYPGRPFSPSSAQPVDMFPSTSHCEMVITFDRLCTKE